MQRWQVPFDYMEEKWSGSQMVCLTAAVIENAKEEERQRSGKHNRKTMDQFTAEQNLRTGA